MADNITYLLGAGASANCLPVINELPERLEQWKEHLQEHSSGKRRKLAADKKHYIWITDTNVLTFKEEQRVAALNLMEDIDWLISELDLHNTVDTLAKKFYLIRARHPDLIKLKKLLLTYFIYEQSFKHGNIRDNIHKEVPDKRYDSLIATIIDDRIDNLNLPDNFKIITWNYDSQFELAYQHYQPSLTLNQIQDKIQSIPRNDNVSKEPKIDLNKFCLVRLNGLASLNIKIPYVGRIVEDNTYSSDTFLKMIGQVVDFYYSLSEQDLTAFTYSWENPEEYEHILKGKKSFVGYAKKIMQETKVLVIVGYSFPLFNRSVDTELLNSLPKNGIKVYIQDTKERAKDLRQFLISSFEIFNRNESWSDRFIKEIESTSQFFIPPDLDLKKRNTYTGIRRIN
ncbi:MAG: hypothetical protein JWQ09_538 [Segetibacter sp.]|nr:hypothetical protein [Segetibacter sp.]